MDYFQRIKSIIIPVFTIAWVVFFTVPMESIITNQKYLVITPSMVCLILVLSVLIATLVLSAFFSLFTGILYKVFRGLICGIILATFIQILFFNSPLGALNGAEPDWNSMRPQIIICFLMWIICIVFNIFFSVISKQRYKTISFALCIAVLSAQTASLVSGILTNADEKKYSEEYVLDGKDQLTFSKEGNVLLISLDYFSKDLFEQILKEYPETRKEYKDFIYYSNVCGGYDYTFPSLCYLYTGTEYTGNVGSLQYLEQAWNSRVANQYYELLHKEGYKTNIYSDINYTAGYGKNLIGKADNLVEAKPRITLPSTVRLIKLSLYRILPTGLKRYVVLSTDDLNEKVEYTCKNDEIYEPMKLDNSFLDAVNNNSLTFINHGMMYSCQHLLGAHVPHTTDQYGKVCKESTDVIQCRGYLYAISKMMNQMKENGAYDNSIIIITADHGSYPSYFVPVLVKTVNASADVLRENNSPGTQNDVIPTIVDLLGEESELFGTSLTTLFDSQERERVFRRFEILEGYGNSKWIGSIGQLNMKKDWGAHHNVLLEYRFTGSQDNLKEMVEYGKYNVLVLKDSFY